MERADFKLDAETWRRAQDILMDVLERPRGNWEAALDAACASEPALRSEVESLLRAHIQSGDFLASFDAAGASALLDVVDAGHARGDMIGSYRIVDRLGQGGMGIVYLAHDTRLERAVALKFLPAHLSSDDIAKQRLVAEARAAAVLDHPNIAVVHEIGESSGGQVFIAMTAYDGETLRETLDRGPVSVSKCIELGRQIADGLSAAHRRGIAHRDIKPSNLLVTTEGTIKILDFGIARVGSPGQANETGTPGTAAYMSPEQAAREPVETSTDVWSLGVVLYEMLAGQRPFAEESRAKLLHTIRTGTPAPVGATRADVPPPLAGLVESCLERESSRRPSARAVAETLRGLGGTLDATVPANAPPRDSLTPHRTLTGSRAWRRSLVLAGAIALASLATLVAKRPSASAVDVSESAVAILPFTTTSADTALDRLGRDLVVTLGTAFQFTDGLHAVDASPILAAIEPGQQVPSERGLALARNTGAGRVVRGSLTRSGDRVRADAVIHRTADGAELARASVTADPRDLTALTDSLAWPLLRQVWGRDASSMPSLAAVTTRSLPALRSYIEGEQAMARADFAAAIRAFENAFAADSSFWFAYWRSLYPRAYESTLRSDLTLVRRMFDNRHTFPQADRLLLESGVAQSQDARRLLLRQVTTQFPNYWPGWYAYANYLVHVGPFQGTSYDDAESALERVLALNPQFHPAWEHFFWIALQTRNSAAARTALPSAVRSGMHVPYRALNEVLTSRDSLSDSTTEAIAGLIGDPSIAGGLEQAATGFLPYGFGVAQVKLSGELAERSADPQRAAVHRWARAAAWASRGAWDSAFVDLDRVRRLSESNRFALRGYGLAVLGSVLGSVTPEAAARWRPDDDARRTPLLVEERAQRAWLDGILASLRGATDDIVRARRDVSASGSSFAVMLDRSLVAFARHAKGERLRSAHALAELEWENADGALHTKFGAHHPFVPAIHRTAASEWLLSSADTATAARLLTWHEAILWREFYPVEIANRVAEPVALFRRAMIEVAREQTGPARDHAMAFLERYDQAPRVHAGWVAAARRVAAR